MGTFYIVRLFEFLEIVLVSKVVKELDCCFVFLVCFDYMLM